MVAPSIRSGAGFRHCTIYALDPVTNTVIAPEGTTPYAGHIVSGVKTLNLTEPQSRAIAHTGDDILIAVQNLPPNTQITGTLTTAKVDDALEALITPNKPFVLGEIAGFGEATSRKGEEQMVTLLAYRQSVITDPDSAAFGNLIWESKLIPLARLIPAATGFTDAAETRTYQLLVQPAKKFPWGVALSQDTHGFKTAGMVRMTSWGKPRLAVFTADGVASEFTLPQEARTATGISVFVAGVPVTTHLTKTVTSITFTEAALVPEDPEVPAAPDEGTVVYALYETEEE